MFSTFKSRRGSFTNMDNLKFIIRHVTLVNDATNSMKAFNNDIENQVILDARTKDIYMKQLSNAKYFEYQFNLFTSKFNVEPSVSVYKTMLENLNDQAGVLVNNIIENCNSELESTRIDLENVMGILEVSHAHVMAKEKVSATIRGVLMDQQEEFNNACNDLGDYELMESVFEKLKKILVFEGLLQSCDSDCEFSLLMEILFEKVKQTFCKNLNGIISDIEPSVYECEYNAFISVVFFQMFINT